MTPDEVLEILELCVRYLPEPLTDDEEAAQETVGKLEKLADWIQELEQQKSPWVSVEERLPQVEISVVASCRSGIFKAMHDGKNWRMSDSVEYIHWQYEPPDYWTPIPLLPKSEEKKIPTPAPIEQCPKCGRWISECVCNESEVE